MKRPAKKPARPLKQAKNGKPSPPRNADGLTPKQRLFVGEYLANGFNATKAARVAGFSAKTADSQGCRLLKNVKVAKFLGAKAQKALEKRDISAERVLDEIAKVAFHDPRKLFNPFGSLIAIHELGDDEAASIAGLELIEMKGTGSGKKRKPGPVLKKIKIADKLKALELLGRHRKLFTDKVEHGADKEFLLTVKSILNGGK